MKYLFTIFSLVLSMSIFAQEEPKVKPVKLKGTMYDRKAVSVKEEINKVYSIYGDFSIEKYVIMDKVLANEFDLNLMLGTLVRIQNTSITGDEINPMSFLIYEMESMTSEDYLFRVFGEEVKNYIEDLPTRFKVHKTDHAECYGICDLGKKGVAIPYKGVLLFLSRK